MAETDDNFELIEQSNTMDLVPQWEPEAWWFFAGGSVLVAIVLLYLFLRKNRVAIDPEKERYEAYRDAKVALDAMEPESMHEIAGSVSLVLRRYLARRMNEPALYETHEEFVGRHEGLKDLPDGVRAEVGDFFGTLAAVKYAPDNVANLTGAALKQSGLNLLEKMHHG
ncbi:MAG: hypothetical protein H7Y36_01975 [Armatimonadetes bacterium]|nr:hypothetical protein [Akkermansiaceae bacterium]